MRELRGQRSVPNTLHSYFHSTTEHQFQLRAQLHAPIRAKGDSRLSPNRRCNQDVSISGYFSSRILETRIDARIDEAFYNIENYSILSALFYDTKIIFSLQREYVL